MTPPLKRGRRNPASKSSEIERRLASGEQPDDIASAVGVTRGYVDNLRREMRQAADPEASRRELALRSARAELAIEALGQRIDALSVAVDELRTRLEQPPEASALAAIIARAVAEAIRPPKRARPTELRSARAERDAEIVRRRDAGETRAQIAVALGVSVDTIKAAMRRSRPLPAPVRVPDDAGRVE